MAADPLTMTDPKRIKILMQNALERGEEGLARLCMRRIFELGGADQVDKLSQRLWQVVTAYEEILKIKHGRAQRATKLRKQIELKGAVAALTALAMEKDVTPGFVAAIETGMAEFTGEYVILEYANRFEDAAVQAARTRLEGFGIALPKTWRSRLN
jgi:hypothetical protein